MKELIVASGIRPSATLGSGHVLLQPCPDVRNVIAGAYRSK